MKCNTLSKILTDYAQSASPKSPTDWASIARILAFGKTKPSSEFLDGLVAEAAATEQAHNPQVRLELKAMRATAVALGKAPFAAALDRLAKFVVMTPVGLLPVIEERLKQPTSGSAKKSKHVSSDPQIASSYLKRLETALGDETGFDEIVIELESNPQLNTTDFKALAKSFTGRAAKSKKDAVESIRARQRNLLDARLKQQFNKGQTAA